MKIKIKKLHLSLAFSSLIFILGISFFYQSFYIRVLWKEPMGPDLYPRIVSILITITSFLNIISELYRLFNKVPDTDGDQSTINWKSVGLIIIAGICYALGLQYLGFFSSTFLFVVIVIGVISYFQDKANWRKIILIKGFPTALGIVIVLLLMKVFLHIYLPDKALLW